MSLFITTNYLPEQPTRIIHNLIFFLYFYASTSRRCPEVGEGSQVSRTPEEQDKGVPAIPASELASLGEGGEWVLNLNGSMQMNTAWGINWI